VIFWPIVPRNARWTLRPRFSTCVNRTAQDQAAAWKRTTGKGRFVQAGNIKMERQHGTSRADTIARLRRDHPGHRYQTLFSWFKVQNKPCHCMIRYITNLIQLVQGTEQALPLYHPVHGSGPGEIVIRHMSVVQRGVRSRCHHS
jgi:hypothetical protein